MVFAHLDNKADNHTYWLQGKVCVHKAHLVFSNYLIIYIFLCIYHLLLQLLPLIYLQIIIATVPFLVRWRCYFSQCCLLSLCLCSHKKKKKLPWRDFQKWSGKTRYQFLQWVSQSSSCDGLFTSITRRLVAGSEAMGHEWLYLSPLPDSWRKKKY